MTFDSTLRVALVAPYDLSAPGGINNQIRAQARALRGLGHDVRIFGPASSPLTDGERPLGRTISVSLGGTESGLGVDPRAFAEVGRMLREGFDIVHVHEPFTPLVPWIVLLRSRAPVVGTFHVYREDGHRLYATFAWALEPLARRLRARIAVSDAARRTVASHFPGEYEIVPNGIEVERFREPRPRPSIFARDRRHVLYVGRLEPRKGVDTLIRAMRDVQRHAPDVTLLVAGDGPNRAALEQLARDTGVAARFAGRLADDDLPAYFQAADIVCSPALGGESFGIVLLEAMACGKPIVASRIDGYVELLGAAGSALLVPPGDEAALASEVLALINNDERRREMARRGAEDVRRYNWDGVARRIIEIYRRVQGT